MFNLFVARKCEIMAVMSRFTVALLTEGRSARDLPKQHPDKKISSPRYYLTVLGDSLPPHLPF